MNGRRHSFSKRPAKIGGVSIAEFMLRMATRHPRPLHPDDDVPHKSETSK